MKTLENTLYAVAHIILQWFYCVIIILILQMKVSNPRESVTVSIE